MRYIKAGRKTGAALLLIMMVMLFCGCGKREQTMNGEGKAQTMRYIQITQEEAQKMMEQDDGHVVVDVRRADEYAEGHIPGAILIPNENIVNTPPEELPDFDQIILVYCRSGRRSKEAAQKLADMGYKKVYEFGGIIDWTGEVMTNADPEETKPENAEESGTDSADAAIGEFDFTKETVLLNSGWEMPIIGTGTWTLSDEEAENSTYYALKSGMRLIDTARYYQNETGVGKGLARAIDEGIVTREEVFITSKIYGGDHDRTVEMIEQRRWTSV